MDEAELLLQPGAVRALAAARATQHKRKLRSDQRRHDLLHLTKGFVEVIVYNRRVEKRLACHAPEEIHLARRSSHTLRNLRVILGATTAQACLQRLHARGLYEEEQRLWLSPPRTGDGLDALHVNVEDADLALLRYCLYCLVSGTIVVAVHSCVLDELASRNHGLNLLNC